MATCDHDDLPAGTEPGWFPTDEELTEAARYAARREDARLASRGSWGGEEEDGDERGAAEEQDAR